MSMREVAKWQLFCLNFILLLLGLAAVRIVFVHSTIMPVDMQMNIKDRSKFGGSVLHVLRG